MMTCRDVAALASAHLDGELAWSRRIGIRVHLAMCVHCRRLVRQLRVTVRALAALRDAAPAVTPAEQERLLVIFRRRPS
jgi:predicted anti-sigma-YlaC factor YlaD